MNGPEVFPWPVLKAIIGGASAIDVPRLALSNISEAEDFLTAYGFEWSDEHQRKEIEALRQEAVAFINEELLNDIPIAIDPQVTGQDDVRQVLLWASGHKSHLHLWSCALLRVMHTFAHCQSYFNDRYGDEIRRQIFERFEPHLSMDNDGLVLGQEIPLVEFQAKPMKPRRSIAMKLLHKPENVATDIFDRLGVRFVTRERFDAILVVRYLRENNVLMFANIKPSRSRNTLIDIDWLMQELDAIQAKNLTRSEELRMLREATQACEYPGNATPDNSHTSVAYHSVQFTCRQMIRIPDPVLGEIRFFFPFEVQVLDENSYHQSRDGLASHKLYKARQREAVQRRVLGRLLS